MYRDVEDDEEDLEDNDDDEENNVTSTSLFKNGGGPIKTFNAAVLGTIHTLRKQNCDYF